MRVFRFYSTGEITIDSAPYMSHTKVPNISYWMYLEKSDSWDHWTKEGTQKSKHTRYLTPELNKQLSIAKAKLLLLI